MQDESAIKINSNKKIQISTLAGNNDRVVVADNTGNLKADLLLADLNLWQKNGTDKIYYNEGKVGIGTNEPERKLDIDGRLQVRGTDFYLGQGKRALVRSNEKLIINYNDYSSSSPDYSEGVQINGKVFLPSIQNDYSQTDNLLIRATGGEIKKGPLLSDLSYWSKENDDVYYSGGYVGIGTDSPNEALDVNNGCVFIHGTSTGNHGRLILKLDAGHQFEFYPREDGLALFDRTASKTSLFINNDGKVGIGTENIDDEAALTIHGEIDNRNKLIDLQQGYGIFSDNVGSGYGGSTRLWFDAPSSGTIILGPRTSSHKLHNLRVRATYSNFEGYIWAKEVKVRSSSPYADYVFKPDYNLPTLEETEQYIKKHKHLKEIPTEKQVKENNGIELGKMNVLLLKKVEELTLYVIQLNNKLKEQQIQINKLNKLINDEK